MPKWNDQDADRHRTTAETSFPRGESQRIENPRGASSPVQTRRDQMEDTEESRNPSSTRREHTQNHGGYAEESRHAGDIENHSHTYQISTKSSESYRRPVARSEPTAVTSRVQGSSAPAHPRGKEGRRDSASSQSFLTRTFGNVLDITGLGENSEVSELRKTVREQELEITSLKSQRHKLSRLLAQTEEQLKAAQLDLGSSRAFVSLENTSDGRQLVEEVQNLNGCIDEQTFVMVTSLPPEVRDHHIDKRALSHIQNEYRDSILVTFMEAAFAQGATLEDALLPTFRYLLSEVIAQNVFGPFIPGAPKQLNKTLREVYKAVREREPQARSARWRSMTYSDAYSERADGELIRTATESYFHLCSTLINTMMGPDVNAVVTEQLTSQNAQAIQEIFDQAIKIQDKMGKVYLSFDYEAGLPWGVSFEPVCMTADLAKGEQTESLLVHLPLGFALHASRGIETQHRRIVVEHLYVSPGPVLCSNWRPVHKGGAGAPQMVDHE